VKARPLDSLSAVSTVRGRNTILPSFTEGPFCDRNAADGLQRAQLEHETTVPQHGRWWRRPQYVDG
jgi:hypothetical protein